MRKPFAAATAALAAVLLLVTPAAHATGSGATPAATVLSVAPHTGLVDDQRVTISGSGFGRHVGIDLQECRTHVVQEFGCEQNDSFAFFEGSGAFSVPFHVSARIDTGKGPVDCRLVAGRCELRV